MTLMRNKNVEFYLSIDSIKEKDKKYWIVRISNKKGGILKEFIDTERSFAEIKGLEWIKCESQHYE